MSTNVEEFQKFHRTLMLDAPKGFVPHYFALPPGKKANPPPGWTKTPYPGRLTFEKALAEMKRGSNIAISGTDTDRLGILDVDWEGVGKIAVPVNTLKVISRKRRGFHYYYWWTDTRTKDNIPAPRETPYGEFRCDFLYVLVPGSYVQSEPSHEWFGTQAQLDAMSEGEKDKIRGGNPDFRFYVLPASEVEHVGQYSLPEQRKVADLDVEHLPEFFKTLYEENHPVETEETSVKKKEKKKGLWRNDTSGFWTLTFEQLFKDKYEPEILRGYVGKDRFPSPLHHSGTGKDTSWLEVESKDGEKFVQMRCWGCVVSHSPLSALAVLAGLGTCQDMGKGKGKPSKLDLRDKATVGKMLEYAKKNGILPEDDPLPYKEKREKKAEEEPKYAAFRMIGNVVYRQCVKDGVCSFARYDRNTRELTYVDKIEETGEVPVAYETAIIATFPRELRPYGTPLELYRALKQRFKFASDQTGHKNHIVVLYLMETGCSPPWKRKNFQLILIGLPASGKGRFIDECKALGDRARKMTMPKEATNQRLNDLLGGGIEIIDESRADDEELEAYIRSRYDPGTVNPRLMDPLSKTAIAGFKVAGPTIITRRRPFLDDANTDRGIVIWCEQGDDFPLEILDGSTELDLQDKLAMFWTEYYDDERLLPTQEELFYHRTDDEIDPRLKLVTTYIMKLARLIGDEAVADLKGFIQEQQRLRRELKAATAEGLCVRAIWDIIQENVGGRTYTYENKNGTRTKVCDTLSHDVLKGKTAIYLTRTPADGGADNESKLAPINFLMIARKAGLGPKEPRSLLQTHSVSDDFAGPEGNRVRCIIFDIEKMDTAFKSFLPDYDHAWKKIFKNDGTQAQLPSDETPPPPSLPSETPVAPSDQSAETATPESTPILSPPAAESSVSEDLANDQITALETCIAVDGDGEKREQERYVLQWMIKRILAGRSTGDPVVPHIMRLEAGREFRDWQLQRATEIIDSFFAEVDRVSDLIYRKRREVEHAAKS